MGFMDICSKYDDLPSQFHGVRPIGKGGFGTVLLVVYRCIQMLVAIKMMERKHFRLFEIEVLTKLSHPHIIHLFEILNGKKFTFLVQEYAQGGTLKEQILEGRLREEKARTFGQLVSALKYCHDQNIIHRT